MCPTRRLAYEIGILFLLCLGIETGKQLLLEKAGEIQGSSTDETVDQIREYQKLVEDTWEELTCFPVPESKTNPKATVSMENSWQNPRSYGGDRVHEGTDIMAGINKPGYYPVISMTDGIVEKVGWLEKGGYRIGIRSKHQIYYYYAHLSSYAKDWKIGEKVSAGTVLGFMGNTGYGPEGTKGKFAVHLHVGIYLPFDGKDLAVNPYWFLKYLEHQKLIGTY